MTEEGGCYGMTEEMGVGAGVCVPVLVPLVFPVPPCVCPSLRRVSTSNLSVQPPASASRCASLGFSLDSTPPSLAISSLSSIRSVTLSFLSWLAMYSSSRVSSTPPG